MEMSDWDAMSDEEKVAFSDLLKQKLVRHFEMLMLKDLVAVMKAEDTRLEASHG